MHYFIFIKKYESFYNYTVSAYFTLLKVLQHSFYYLSNDSACKALISSAQIFLTNIKMFDYNISNEFLIIFNLFYEINNDSRNQHNYFEILTERE